MNNKPAKFSLKDIHDMHESKVVIIVDNNVYDVTNYIDRHPGGREILLKNNRKDATEAFNLIAHSGEAKELLKNYKIGIVEEGANQEPNHFYNASSYSNSSVNRFIHIKHKLVTHEDPYFFHKTLGVIVLLHIVIRSTALLTDAAAVVTNQQLVNFTSDNLFSNMQKVFFALCHGALSLSSFIFFVPAHSSQSKPMIHKMFRSHNVCFALRAVICMIIDILIINSEFKRFLISCVVLSCFIIADLITKRLSLPTDRYKTTDSMPYWAGCSVEREKLHKNFYAFAQFLASMVCLFGSYNTIFFTLPAIQGAAFLMTLVRKNLITNYMYHQIYTFLLFYPIPLLLIISPGLSMLSIAASMFMFYLRKYNINKYLLWLPVLSIANLMEVENSNYFYVVIISVSIFFVTLYLVKKHFKVIEAARADNNNRVISNCRITPDSYELVIRTKAPINLEVGQHILIQINDSLNRKYTPIWSQYIKETDQSLLALRIKEYKNDTYQTVSHYLAQCKEGSVIDLHGPYGSKFYCPKRVAIIDTSSNRQYDINKYQICLFSAGSGITPIYELAKNICNLGYKKVKLVTCDQSYDYQMLGTELIKLKKNFPNLLDWVCFFSKEEKGSPVNFPCSFFKERLTPNRLKDILQDTLPGLVIICGPNEWQDMIVRAVKEIQNFQHEILVW